MSGPSLRKQDAHSSIHDAALNEAKELRELYAHCVKEGKQEKALQVAEITIEHWESRTLAHAQSEEEGLYKEMVEEYPHLHDTVVELTRDHDIMRRIVGQMREMLHRKEATEAFSGLIDALIAVDLIHNEDEMNKLLATHT